MRVRSEKPEYELYMPDGSHPSEAGTLLAANVIFSVIYGKPYTSDIRAGVPQQQAEYLRQVAQQTVFDNLRRTGRPRPAARNRPAPQINGPWENPAKYEDAFPAAFRATVFLWRTPVAK